MSNYNEVFDGAARWCIEHASMLDLLPLLPPDSLDSCVCDPPYELGFMSRKWDRSGIAFRVSTWAEILRVLKPGAHLLAFGGTRTAHRIATAIEDAGFEIRDSIEWAYGSGFPKSLNVGKAADAICVDGAEGKWAGFGTALKPSHEPIIVARKPLQGTVVGNVLAYGTGALNIDGCRVAHASAADLAAHRAMVAGVKSKGGSMADSWANISDLSGASDVHGAGRWPPNMLLTHAADCRVVGSREVKANPTWNTPNRECASTFTGAVVSDVRHEGESLPVYECAEGCPVAEMDRQSGEHASRFFPQSHWTDLDDAAPFFYTAKAARSERDRGLEGFRRSAGHEATNCAEGSAGLNSPRAGAGRTGGSRNVHPTVKPIEVLRWLCRLATPPKGIVLDPFAGSGSCGVAAALEGLRYLGIELNDTAAEPFATIARSRIAHVVGGYVPPMRDPIARAVQPAQCSLFDRLVRVG